MTCDSLHKLTKSCIVFLPYQKSIQQLGRSKTLINRQVELHQISDCRRFDREHQMLQLDLAQNHGNLHNQYSDCHRSQN